MIEVFMNVLDNIELFHPNLNQFISRFADFACTLLVESNTRIVDNKDTLMQDIKLKKYIIYNTFVSNTEENFMFFF